MSGNPTDCLGCAHVTRRLKASKPRLWCSRYHCLAHGRCIDFRTKPSALKAALNFFKSTPAK